MAGSLKNFVYTSDNGVRYAVRRDESNAELEDFGFEDLTPADDGIQGLPRNITPRFVNVLNSVTGATRRLEVGNPDAERFISGGIILLALIANVAGAGGLFPFSITSAIGEVVRLFSAADSGLVDDDADD